MPVEAAAVLETCAAVPVTGEFRTPLVENLLVELVLIVIPLLDETIKVGKT